MPHWGRHFPSVASGAGRKHLHWGGKNRGMHFSEAAAGVPSTPAGAGAFELVLDTAATVTFVWNSGVAKHRSGLEQRANNIDDPAARYNGEVLLRGGEVRNVRTRIARQAAQGLPFLLGLPWEAAAIVAHSTGTTITVTSTAELDWAEPGVRVLVRHGTYGATSTIIQSVTPTTIEVLDTLGDVGRLGAMVMPLVSILLNAQQGFDRYQPSDPVERWKLSARNADAGPMIAATAAGLDLHGTLAGLRVERRELGPTDNRVITLSASGGSPTGTLEEGTLFGIPFTTLRFQSGVTTVADAIAALSASPFVRVVGTPASLSATLDAGDTLSGGLTGGTNAAPIVVGKGATLTTYRGRPVWDRGIVIVNTVSDSVQTMSVIIDLGGLPSSAQTAAVPDWGRAVAADDHIGEAWQWTKKMLWTIAGSWGSFWLSTYREELLLDSVGVGTLTVINGDDAGDVWTWYPNHRRDLVIALADGTTVYARIATGANNGDGTTTLSVVDEDDVPLMIAGTIETISWLERVRLESDEVAVTFGPMSFALAVQARTARQGGS